MKKTILSTIALFLLIVATSVVSFAQTISATTYPFTNSTGATLVDMSSGTTTLIGANADDNASGVVNIGFDFWFVGTRYTQFSVNANGLLRLGLTNIGTTFSNAMASITNTPEIAPYWDDLVVGTNGKIHSRSRTYSKKCGLFFPQTHLQFRGYQQIPECAF